MTKVSKSAILKGRSLAYEADVADPKNLPYPILALKECHYVCQVSKLADYNHGSYQIEALLTLEDSRDAVPFDKKISLNEEVDFLDKEDDTGEGFICEGNSIDLDDIALRIIVASLPIRVCRPGKAKDLGVKKEDEEKDSKPSPFDKLKDLDL